MIDFLQIQKHIREQQQLAKTDKNRLVRTIPFVEQSAPTAKEINDLVRRFSKTPPVDLPYSFIIDLANAYSWWREGFVVTQTAFVPNAAFRIPRLQISGMKKNLLRTYTTHLFRLLRLIKWDCFGGRSPISKALNVLVSIKAVNGNHDINANNRQIGNEVVPNELITGVPPMSQEDLDLEAAMIADSQIQAGFVNLDDLAEQYPELHATKMRMQSMFPQRFHIEGDIIGTTEAKQWDDDDMVNLNSIITHDGEARLSIIPKMVEFISPGSRFTPELKAASLSAEEQKALSLFKEFDAKVQVQAKKEREQVRSQRMKNFNDLKRTSPARRAMPTHNLKAVQRKEVTRKKEEPKKEAWIAMIDDSSSMSSDKTVMPVVKAILAQMLLDVIEEKSELYICVFESALDYTSAIAIRNKEEAMEHLKDGGKDWLPSFSRGVTDIEKSVEQLFACIKKGEFNRHTEITADTVKVVVINDGNDTVNNPDRYYGDGNVLNAFMIGGENETLKKLCETNNGKFEVVRTR